MALNTAILRVQVLVDNAKAKAGMDDVSGSVGRFQKGVGKMAAPAALALGSIVALGTGAAAAASDMEQAFGGIDAVFGASADQVKSWAKTASDSVGLAASEYGNLATLIGSQLKNAGTPLDQVAGKTDTLIKLGADLAATYGGTTADAVAALSSALKGEMDPLEKYGTSLSQTAVNAQMAADGTDKLTGKQQAAAKQAATLALITKQTADAHGKFASEAQTAAGQQARATAAAKNAQAALGQALLPTITAVTKSLTGMAKWIADNSKLVLVLAGVVTVLAGAVLTAHAVLTLWPTLLKIVTAAQWLWNAAMSANPIMLVVLAVAALIAATVILFKRSSSFRAFVLKMWASIQAAATATARVIKAVWAAMWSAIKAVAGVVFTVLKAYFTVYKTVAVTAFRVITATAKALWSALKAGAAAIANSPVWGRIQRVGAAAINALLHPIEAVKRAFDAVVEAIRKVIDWLSKLKFPSPPGWLSKLPGVGSLAVPAPAPGLAPSPTLRMAPPGAAGAGAGVTINVYGLLDGADAARKIRQVLREDDRRRSGVQLRRSRG